MHHDILWLFYAARTMQRHSRFLLLPRYIAMRVVDAYATLYLLSALMPCAQPFVMPRLMRHEPRVTMLYTLFDILSRVYVCC